MRKTDYIANLNYYAKAFTKRPRHWHDASTKYELTLLYRALIPELREIARQCGYGLGVHGTMQRDLDLIAVPWVKSPLKPATLAKRIHIACTGSHYKKINWTQKPQRRIAVAMYIGTHAYIDLSIIPPIE